MAVQKGRFVGRMSRFIAAGAFWTTAGLTIIWQLMRGSAGTDPVKLIAAAPQNPDPQFSQNPPYSDLAQSDAR